MAKMPKAAPEEHAEMPKGRRPDYVLRIRQPKKLKVETGKYELNENYITIASLWATEWPDKQTGEIVKGFGVRFHLSTIELRDDAGGIIVPYREWDQQ